MRRRRFVSLAGTIGGIAIAGCADTSDGSDDAAPADDSSDDQSSAGADGDDSGGGDTEAELERNAIGYPSEYIEIRDVEYGPTDNQFMGPKVTGVVENVSGEELSYVSVEVQAFDEDDVQIDDGIDNTTDLREGRGWKFEATFHEVEMDEIAYWMGRAEVTNY